VFIVRDELSDTLSYKTVKAKLVLKFTKILLKLAFSIARLKTF